MRQPHIARLVAIAKAYAAHRGLRYLPVFKKRHDGAFFDEPLAGWKAVQLLETAGVLSAGTFDAWRVGAAAAIDALATYSWCEVCRDAPVARADGLCIWCSLAPIGRPRELHTAHAA